MSSPTSLESAAIAPASRRSRLRRWVRPWVNPVVFDFWAQRLHPTWSWERPLARLVAREQASIDSFTLWLKPNRHVGAVRPGQHFNVSAEIDGAAVTRSYSLSHLPRADGCLAITVKAIEGGKLSSHLCHDLSLGARLGLSPAFGDMALPAQPSGRWLFLAAGSGITPLACLTRELAARDMPVELDLVYWARCRDELCFIDALRALEAAHPRLRVHVALTREPGAMQPGEARGRIDEALLQDLVGPLDGRQVFACGPDGFVDRARQLLAARSESFQAEAFTPPQPAVDESGTVEVRLAASGRTLRLPRGVSLLEALEAEGLRPRHGCRMGLCNTCACEKPAGIVRHLPSGELVREPMSSLRLCIHGAASDLTINL
ncbi:MAG: ferredoxin reductase [Lysobacteraceae bacterium]